MLEELAEVMRFLSVDGYVVRTPQGYYVFTNKFYKEYSKQDVGIVVDKAGEVVLAKSQGTVIAIPQKRLDAKESRDAYLQFIVACGVPARLVNPRGESYAANQYSEQGRKAFAKILERARVGEIDLELLVKTAQLYYKGSASYKLKIGNYIGEGAWESDYQNLMTALTEGKGAEHIKQSVKNDNEGTSRYTVEPRKNSGLSQPIQGKSFKRS